MLNPKPDSVGLMADAVIRSLASSASLLLAPSRKNGAKSADWDGLRFRLEADALQVPRHVDL